MTDEHKSSLAAHPYPPDASFDGGDLDCGSGLLLLIRKHIDPLAPGQLLEIRSTEISVREDLPAWCRLTRNELVSELRDGRFGDVRGYLLRRAARIVPAYYAAQLCIAWSLA